MSEANVKALRRFIAEARRVGCMRPHDGRQLDEDMEGLILGADDAAKRLSAIVREREEYASEARSLRERLKDALAEVESWRQLKLHNEGTTKIVRALNDRRALAEKVREACAKEAYRAGASQTLAERLRDYNLDPLLEPKEGA